MICERLAGHAEAVIVELDVDAEALVEVAPTAHLETVACGRVIKAGACRTCEATADIDRVLFRAVGVGVGPAVAWRAIAPAAVLRVHAGQVDSLF